MFTQWLVRLRALFRREDVEREFDEEIRFHLDLETERLVARGMPLESARRAAVRDFGEPGRVKEEARETWRWRWLDELLQDARYAGRGLARNVGYAVVGALSLGFGIGATTTLFSVVDALDFRPLPYRDADRLVWFGEVRPSHDRFCPGCPLGTSPSVVAQWASQARSFEAFALWASSDVYLRQGDVATNVTTGYASAGFFEFLGVSPHMGRDIAADDTVSGAETVALLSYDAWQNRFGGEHNVLGSRIEYHVDPALSDSRAATVVGVLPKDFRFGREAFFWVALSERAGAGRWIDAMARLRPEVTPVAAAAELRSIAARLAETDPAGSGEREVSIRPLRERLGQTAGRGRLLLFGITTLVLLLAVMNVTGMALARTMSRRYEMTVRRSLGASPTRLVRQLLVEGICLASLGGAIGALLVVWGLRLASHSFGMEASGLPLRIDYRVIAFSAAATVIAGILTALLPAAWAARWNLQKALGDRSAASVEPGGRRIGGALLGAQIALALVLVTAGGVLSSEFLKLRYLDLGFRPEELYQVFLFGSPDLRASPEAWRPALEAARLAVAGAPGVTGAALRHSSAIHPAVVRPEGSADDAPGEAGSPRVQAVDADFFETFAARILAGRGFTPFDRRGAGAVCIVNLAAATAFWPGEPALGRQVFVGDSTGGEWLTVIGIAGNIEQGEMVERRWPTIYRPLDQAPLHHPAASLYVRMARRGGTDLAALQSAVREALGHPASAFRPVAGELDQRFRTQRFNALALNLFAGFAVLLAAMGIYGSVAYTVARRTREIGVRVALGAQRGRVLRMVATDTVGVAAAGLALGLLGSVVLTRALQAFVSATSAANPITFAAASLLVGFVVLVATWLPARRATDVDPLIALRSD